MNPGDLADQADALIAENEREAIDAALAGRRGELDEAEAARPDRITDEPVLDFGDGDDSADPTNAGGDDMSLGGAPEADRL